MKKLGLLLTSSIYLCVSRADAKQCYQEIPSGTAVYFGNGMFTPKEDAMRQLEMLRDLLHDRIQRHTPTAPVIYRLAYNENEFFLTQALEVISQYQTDRMTSFLDTLRNVLPAGEGKPPWVADLLGLIKKAPRVISGISNEIRSALDEDLRQHVASYRENLYAGRKILIFPHSQGNFYANEAYGYFGNRENNKLLSSIGIIGLAAPTSYISGDGPYITNHGDVVIKGVIELSKATPTLGKQTLPTNHEPDRSRPLSPTEHLFSDYLSVANTDALIAQYTDQALGKLVQPDALIKPGMFTITMEWLDNSENDLDLRVTEPDGTVVSLSNATGKIGILDRDRLKGPGPEHYVVACGKLQPGNYKIGVRKFGRKEDNVRLTVQDAYGFSEISRPLPSNGNATRLDFNIALVEVTKNDGVFSYKVVEQ